MGEQDTTTTTTLDVQPTETPPAQAGQGAPAKTFTQDDLNRIAGEARDKGRQTALTDLLSQLGVENVDTLKEALGKLSQIENERKSEAEKLQDAEKATKKEKDLREAAEKALEDALEQQHQNALNTAIRTHAAALRAEHPEDVVTWARSGGHDLSKLLTDDGTVVEDEVKKLVEVARKDRPKWFIGTGPGSPSNADGRAPDHDTASKQNARVDAENRARNIF